MIAFPLSLIECNLIECLLHAFTNVLNVGDSCAILTAETIGKQINVCGVEFSGLPHLGAGLGWGPGPGS